MANKNKSLTRAVPLNFLLGCSDRELMDFQLARLAALADLRKQLHEILDEIVEQQGQASLAAWFRLQDRATLRQTLEDHVPAVEWAKAQLRAQGRSEAEAALIPLPALPPGKAHQAAALRYQERQNAAGLCAVCSLPLARGSVRFCETHLAMARARNAKGALPGTRDWLYGDLFESMHGRQPGTLAALARTRERQHRSSEKEKLLYSRVAEQVGVSPTHVRCVALGQRRSEAVSVAIEKQIQREATEVLAAIAEASEKRKKKKGRAASAFGVSVEKLVG